MGETNGKQEARRPTEGLPEDATGEDLMYRVYVRQAIKAGLADSYAGRTIDVRDVHAKLGLPFRTGGVH